MDEQNRTARTDHRESAGEPGAPDASPRVPYQRSRPHVSQAPITDAEPQYVMPNRYVSVEQAHANRPRKHMGVASSDPEYLPATGKGASGGYIPPSSPTLRIRANERGGAGPAAGGQTGQLHYDRYLQVPKKGHAIFSSRQSRQRRRIQLLLAVLIVAAVVLALVWFFVLR